jgi:DNA-binding NarL/FixJ family response regulator
MKILVIDDHPIVLEGMTALLQHIGEDAEVLTAHDAQEGLALLDEQPDLDVVLLDLILPGISGLLAITEFGRKRPALPIIVLSSSEDPADVRKALSLGALGYVPKSATQKTLLSAIRFVLNGDLYVPSFMADKADDNTADRPRKVSAGAGRLTERQIEILSMLAEGQPNNTTAGTLNLSEKTVKAHVSAIFKALNVVNRTQAAAVGREEGFI